MTNTDDTGEWSPAAADVDQAAAELAFEDDWESCSHDHDDYCYDDLDDLQCHHQHCFNCGECECAGYCDDYQTYNLRPDETGGGAPPAPDGGSE